MIEAELRPGVSTAHLDALAEAHIRASGAIPSFKGYPGINPRRPFPASVCISIDDEIVHGIPGARTIRAGQIVSVDAGAIVDGWHGDGGADVLRRRAAAQGRRADRPDPRRRCWRASPRPCPATTSRTSRPRSRPSPRGPGSGVIRQFVGHGIGTAMHEEPQVPNYRTGRPGRKLEAGPVPGDRADVHPRRPRHPDPAPTTGRSSPPTARWRPISSIPSRSPTDGPQILTQSHDRRLPGSAIFDTLRVRVSARPGRHCA